MSDTAWIIKDFEAALAQLSSALDTPADSNLIKAGCIQYFEFTFELAWKTCKLLGSAQGLPECLSPKACLRQAFTLGWIEEEEVWLGMLEARNRMSHTYDAHRALEIYDALPRFNQALTRLLAELRQASRAG